LVTRVKDDNAKIAQSQWSQIVSATSIDTLQTIQSLTAEKLAQYPSVDHFCRQALEIADQKIRHFIAFELIYKDAKSDQDYNLDLFMHAYANPQSFIALFNKAPNHNATEKST